MSRPQLSTWRQVLVDEHLYLVGNHLRRCFVNRRGSGGRDADDLYQEGCLGLILAARAYQPDCGIPFAAFAARRIHYAISEAIGRDGPLIRLPRHVRSVRRRSKCHDPGLIPMVKRMQADPPDHRHKTRTDPGGGRSIREHLRDHYETALREVRHTKPRRRSPRRDRQHLVELIIDNRLLIPNERYKTSLHEIARTTRSSYARVAACEKQLLAAVRSRLEQNPQFCSLMEEARRSPLGLDAVSPVVDLARGPTGSRRRLSRTRTRRRISEDRSDHH